MKKRYFYLISFTFLMFLVFLFLVSAADPDKWIECASTCGTSKCSWPYSGVCCKSGEPLADYCCISNTWAAPGSDVCDGLDNDCNAATADGSGETAPDCALQSGVCAGSRKSCSGGSWLACTSANYVTNNVNYESTESACSDGLDNDCDGTADCADTDCIGVLGPGGANCCRTATLDANCGNDDCKIENCVSNQCSITDREAGAIDECGTCQACDTDGGNCDVLPQPNNEGKDCTGPCTYCDDAGVCADRNTCAATECLAGSGTYCDAGGSAGGTCKNPDESSDVCLSCAPDQTAATWTWTPPNHQDAGKGFDSKLFDSNGNACLPPSGGSCYDSNNNAVNHKSSLTTGNCCGDDASEYYKPDYYAPECTSDVNDCVWSTGDAQASNTGNKEYWCYQHEWNECKANSDIGKKVGGVTCAGTASSKAWTPNSIVKTENQYSCTDGLDNDGDTKIDCADTDCAGIAGPDGATCCQTAANCPQDDCKIESCTSSNTCSITNRLAGATDECGTCQACDKDGGDCVVKPDAEGKNCPGSCTYCNNAGTCTNRAQGATDECGTCQACNAAGPTGICAGISDETGKGCTSNCYDCVSGSCNAVTESNDGSCNDDCTYCNAGTCTNRDQCTATECAAGSYCNALGGNCATPDESSDVCLSCAPDQTAATWTWTPPNHQDAGKGFDSKLFDSNGNACLPPSGGSCYDSNNNAVNHKSSLTTGNCCGDDASEYYKPDYYAPECTSDVNDCVWSTGDAQSSNTGNAPYWCYLHEWYICKAGDANTVPIGTKVGPAGSQVTCAGVSGNQKWTPSSLLLPENQYSCSDSLDNDGDTKIDCADSDCAGTISGSVKDTNNAPIGSAKIDVLNNAVVVHTTFANALGSYTVNDNLDVICGSYDMISSATGYVSSTRTMQLQPNQALQNVDFALALGTTCEADCTYAGDDLIHAECQGVNNCDLCNFNCGFCNPAIAASSCNLAKIGWIRDYNDPNQLECQETGCVVECGEGCPIAKIETKSSVTCDEENIIKVTKLVTYKGKLAKLVIVTCG